MSNDSFSRISLSLFDGAGAGAGAGSGDGSPAAAGQGTGDTGEGMAAASGTNGNSDDIENVVAQKTPEERRKAYDDFISGEGKEFYQSDVQRIIDRRFKETKNLENRINENEPILAMLHQRYGTEKASDLMEALENDTAYWEQMACDAGFPDVDSYMRMQRLERENAALMNAQREARARNEADQTVARWFNEAEGLKGKYRNFDFRQELANPHFVSMLKAGVPVEHAYKTLHFDELMADNAAQAAQRTEASITDNIRARGQRPQEAGLNSQNGISSKISVSKLDKAQRAELARRAARGETISFTS